MKRWLTASAMAALAVVSFALSARPTIASHQCSADYTSLGQMPGLTGPTPTDWFNVFGFGFKTGTPITITFDAPVHPYAVDHGTTVLPPVTTYTVYGEYVYREGWKATFRVSEAGAGEIRVTMVGTQCQASMLVNMNPNAPSSPLPSLPPTATLEHETVPDQPPLLPVVLACAAIGVVLARRRLPARR